MKTGVAVEGGCANRLSSHRPLAQRPLHLSPPSYVALLHTSADRGDGHRHHHGHRGSGFMAGLPIAQFPNIVPPQIQVQTTYVGADALTVEASVATPIEQEMSGVEGMEYMYSINANNGMYDAQRHFRDVDRADDGPDSRADASDAGFLPIAAGRAQLRSDGGSSRFFARWGFSFCFLRRGLTTRRFSPITVTSTSTIQ